MKTIMRNVRCRDCGWESYGFQDVALKALDRHKRKCKGAKK